MRIQLPGDRGWFVTIDYIILNTLITKGEVRTTDIQSEIAHWAKTHPVESTHYSDRYIRTRVSNLTKLGFIIVANPHKKPHILKFNPPTRNITVNFIHALSKLMEATGGY